jgi:heptosyltransferase-1
MRVLIVKTSALGDIVQAFPVAEYLKSIQNVDTIGWVAEDLAKELLESNPFIDEIIPISSKAIKKRFPSCAAICEFRRQRDAVRRNEWDLILDLQGNCKSACVTLMARSEVKVGWGFKYAPEKIAACVLDYKVNPPHEAPMREQYLSIAKSYFHDNRPFSAKPFELQLTDKMKSEYVHEVGRWPTDRPIWIVALGSRWKNKMCVTEEMALALGALQKENNMYFVFTAATTQELNEAGTCLRMLPHSFPGNVLYQVSLPVVQHLIARSERFIGVDSLMLHLASTTQTPTLSFFGCSSSILYAPAREGDIVQQGVCPEGKIFTKRCSDIRTCLTGDCMKHMKAKQIESTIRRWIQKD